LLLVGGCAGSTPRPAVLSLQSEAGGREFAQTFPHAYFSQNDDGDREIILINDGNVKPAHPTAGPIQPVAALPLQQVMHFKILWNPLSGTHTDAPSTTNAVINWTIRAARPGEAGDSLHYRGAGFVQLEGDSQRLEIVIRNASIQPTSHTGILVDPLGTSTLNGRFVAYRNDGLVKGALADLQNEPPTASEASAEMDPSSSGPPPRSPAP
jgi:hypothetical protein